MGDPNRNLVNKNSRDFPAVFLSVKNSACGGDSGFTGLLNVPFIQSGKPHGNAVPAEDHTAFHFGLAAHVESTGLGEFPAEGGDYLCVYAGTDQNFGTVFAVPDGKKLSDDFFSGNAVAGGAAGQDGINTDGRGIPVGLGRIYGNIDATVEGQSGTGGGICQHVHSLQIQIAVGIQTADDETVSTICFQVTDLLCHLQNFLFGVKKVTATGTHKAAYGNIADMLDLPQQGSGRGQTTHGKS